MQKPTNQNPRRLALTNGRIFAGSGWDKPTWADYLLVENGNITEVGKASETSISQGSAEIVNLEGALVLPGLCDAHLHLSVGGRTLRIPNLEGLDQRGVIEALKEYASSLKDLPAIWIEAINWESWLCQLNADLLDDVLPGRCVVVFSRDLHSCCCSMSALSAAGIDRDTADPQGGIIERDSNQRPNGVLREAATGLIKEVMPPPTADEIERAILRAQDYIISLGLTAINEMLYEGSEQIYRRLDEEDRLKIDIDAWLKIEDWDGSSIPPADGNRFRNNTLKLFLDGALGSRTAAMYEPYLDVPDMRGVLFYTDNELRELVRPALEKGWSLAIHAIGDRAVEQACRLLSKSPGVGGRLHRIEHVQVLPEDGVRMFAESGAAASIQPVHLIDDQRWLPPRIGKERCRRSYCWRSLYNAGISIAFGSDWPVASPDPLLNLHAAINRCGFDDLPSEYFDMNEGLPPFIAIRTATHGWAVAVGLSDKRGSITPGQSADLTVVSGVSDDLSDWSKAGVLMTISRGEVVFKKSESEKV